MFSIIEGAGTALPNQLLIVEVSDLDGYTVMYAVTSGTVSCFMKIFRLILLLITLDCFCVLVHSAPYLAYVTSDFVEHSHLAHTFN